MQSKTSINSEERKLSYTEAMVIRMNIRFASDSDIAALRAIYAQYIDTPVTFESVLPTFTEFSGRIANISVEYPYLVCEEEGRVIGYAYAHRQRERAAYQWNAELSVYIDKDFTSRGIGKKMYCALIGILKKQGIKTVYGVVTLPNIKSEKLHLSLGFRHIGTYRNTGYKCGRWHDVAWFEKEIAPYEKDPSPVVSVSDLPEKEIGAVILTCMENIYCTGEPDTDRSLIIEAKFVLLSNLDKLHTTELGAGRIKKNIEIDVSDVVSWCRNMISSPDCRISKKGKNWYADTGDCIITVNASSYTIITAHKSKRNR